MSHTLFISDLHLQADRPDITEQFRDFMRNQAPGADALYILGDFFEVWVGDDDTSDFIDSVKDELRKLTQSGVPVYMMAGNRDFLMGQQFMRDVGCLMLDDPCVVELYGERMVLCHGDLLCTDDKTHQWFRRVVHWRFGQKFYLILPLSWRRIIANMIRKRSIHYNTLKSAKIMDVNNEAVIQLLLKHGCEHLIHGHTHREDTHKIAYQSKTFERIVLGNWHEGVTFFRIDAK